MASGLGAALREEPAARRPCGERSRRHDDRVARGTGARRPRGEKHPRPRTRGPRGYDRATPPSQPQRTVEVTLYSLTQEDSELVRRVPLALSRTVPLPT